MNVYPSFLRITDTNFAKYGDSAILDSVILWEIKFLFVGNIYY